MVQRLKPAAESLYGFPQPTQSNLVAPIISKRDPTTADIGYPLGQSWVNTNLLSGSMKLKTSRTLTTFSSLSWSNWKNDGCSIPNQS